jgi:hypothetical protein
MVPFDGGSPRGGSSGAGNNGNGGADGIGSDGLGAIGWMEKANQASSVVAATATFPVKPEV